MRSVVDHVVDGIITINEQGIVTAFNPAAQKIFGYTVSEVAGQNVKILMPDPYHGEHDDYLTNYLRTGVARIIGSGREVVGRRKDGSMFPMDLAVSEFWVEDTRHFTGIVRDITARRRVEQSLQEQAAEMAVALGKRTEEARRAEKAEELLREADRRKDEFLATLAHELRNPPAPLRNALELLRRTDDNQAVIEQARSMMERQVSQMVRLVDDLLDISRIRTVTLSGLLLS